MGDVSLWEVWSRWLSGEETSNLTLWGQSVFVWGRVGKTLQFVGGLAVAAEIVGPARLSRLGQSLHGWPHAREARLWLSTVASSAWDWLLVRIGANSNDVTAWLLRGLAVGVLSQLVLAQYGAVPSEFFELTATALALAVLVPIGAIGVMTLLAALSFALDRVLQWTASALQHRNLGWWAKTTGFLLFLGGSAFDLMAT